jgi:phospholipase/lecithinase/hemolysin
MRQSRKRANAWQVGLILFALSVSSACQASTQTTEIPPTPTATPAPVSVAGFGILGDSNSDEYRADDDRGGEYADTTLSWVEQLVDKRGLNFGAWGTWGEPRRTGYEYNWARSGATTDTLLGTGQHLGLAEQIAGGEVSHVLIWIGENDFETWNGTYQEIYDGTLSDAQVQAKVDRVVANITTAINTLQAADDVPIVVVTIVDKGLTPDMAIEFPDSAGRKRVSDAIRAVNRGLGELAASHGVVVIDTLDIWAAQLKQIDLSGQLKIGDEKISIFAKGDEPHNGRLGDSAGHIGTVLSGILANEIFINPFDREFGLDLVPLSDEEILESAGLK